MKPLDFRKVGDQELLIIWEDGERSLYAAPYLQINCRCAKCVDEMTGERRISASDIDAESKIVTVEPVGGYALRFVYSKGCQSGIYSFDYLRSICPRLSRVSS